MQDSLLSNLSIGELAEVVGGCLRLGAMPPLDGDLEPVGPVVVESRHVQAGDVFWALDQAGEHGARFAEVAFSRDAAGAVVSRRRLEPWAGKFSIEVPDARLALWQLAAYMRGQFHGSVVGVAGARTSRTSAWVTAVADRQTSFAPQNLHDDASVRVPLDLLNLPFAGDMQVVQWPEIHAEQLKAFSHLCDPDIVVITTTHKSNTGPLGQQQQAADTLESLRDALPERSWVVVSADACSFAMRDSEFGNRVIRVGTDRHCELAASGVSFDDGLRFEVAGQPVCLKQAKQTDLIDVLTAFAVGRLLGKTEQHIARQLDRAAIHRDGGTTTTVPRQETHEIR